MLSAKFLPLAALCCFAFAGCAVDAADDPTATDSELVDPANSNIRSADNARVLVPMRSQCSMPPPSLEVETDSPERLLPRTARTERRPHGENAIPLLDLGRPGLTNIEIASLRTRSSPSSRCAMNSRRKIPPDAQPARNPVSQVC